jgi:Tol biopolymer transport system component
MRHFRAALVVVIVVVSSGCAYVARSDVGMGSAPANGSARLPDVSGSGRFVAFESSASNLVPGDTNGAVDVFVRDHRDGTTRRVSTSGAGAQGNNASHQPSISDDGNLVAFQSYADNLVPGDTNGYLDVFVKDLRTGFVQRVSVSSTGAQADGASGGAAISGNGRFVAFTSYATNLAREADTNGVADIFVHERGTGVTATAPDEHTGDRFGPDISDDGDVLVYATVDSITVVDRTSIDHPFEPPRSTQFFAVAQPAISGDGRTLVYTTRAGGAGDGNGTVRDVESRTVTLTESAVSLGPTRLLSQGPDCAVPLRDSVDPAVSDDGRVVAFVSASEQIDHPDGNASDDVFVWSHAGEPCPRRVSATDREEELNGPSGAPALSDDGKYVGFDTRATNLVGSTAGSKVALRYALAPDAITSGDAAVARGTAGVITLSHAYFAPDVQVQVVPGEGITATVVANRTSAIDIRVSVDPSAAPTPRTFFVTNPGNTWNSGANGAGACVRCLVIR